MLNAVVSRRPLPADLLGAREHGEGRTRWSPGAAFAVATRSAMRIRVQLFRYAG
ncbi:MAG: hypothetical protein KBF43_14055 [Dermatophilaceae bacterium]|nr:hypothetical protein [Dermatophilaceae bacterium]